MLSSAFLGDQVIAEVKINETTLTVKAMPDDQKRVGKISVHFSQRTDRRLSRECAGTESRLP